MYLYELVNWLTTVVDSLVIKDVYKDKAYRAAVEYLAGCLTVGSSRPCLVLSRWDDVWCLGLLDWAKRPNDQRERNLKHPR